MLNYGSLITIKKLQESRGRLKRRLKKLEILSIFLTGKLIIELLLCNKIKTKRAGSKTC